jgi:uncharacterized protein (TIGR03083 family)
METIKEPIGLVDLLPVLDGKLLELLKSLTPEQWQAQTVAKRWKVKDVVAHLLDGNIRILSILRDNHYGENADIRSYQDLVDFLNRLNADWVEAMKRVSPQMLMLLHEITGPLYCDYYKTLAPYDKAAFSVAWAGENESRNWMHIAREYTEKFLHQQQIREAVGKPGLMTRDFFYPFMNVFMYALPYTYRDVTAADGASVKVTVTSEIGGAWYLLRADNTWKLVGTEIEKPTAEVIIQPEDAWPLFSKSVRAVDVRHKITIVGDQSLGEMALTMVSVMA